MPENAAFRLKQRAQQFHERLQAIKRSTPLPKGIEWYPWPSLGQFDILDEFLHGETAALLDLIGRQTVLDIGCGDGDVAYFLEHLGCRVNVVDYAHTNYNALLGVRALKEKLGSSIGIHAVDLDRRPHLPVEHCGLTIMLGVLYHLKNPFLVLETIAQHSRYLFMSTRVAAFGPDHKHRISELPVAYLVEADELNHDYTNYWIFSEEGLKRIMHRAGWDLLHYTTRGPIDTADPVSPKHDARAYLLAKSRIAAAPSVFKAMAGWHEVEQGSWRWTERKFSLELDVQESRSPATLRFLFQLPEALFKDAASVTLSARVNGEQLAPAAYTHFSEQEYQARVDHVSAGPVYIEFELDRAIAPSLNDQRELGVLVDLTGPPPVTIS